MARTRIDSFEIAGLAVCTGPEVQHTGDLLPLMGGDEAALGRLEKMTGIRERRIAPSGVTTLDLGEAAARKLLGDLGIDASQIDAILFVTQTPDHFQPCNANLLHGRLGCPTEVAAMDINQGCSGWVYGLYLAACMVECGGCSRVLLLAGDTVSQSIHPGDRSTLPLFGDACAATMVVRGDSSDPGWFSLHSDGRGRDAICLPAGAYRMPLSGETSVESVDGDGNRRTPAHLHMNGLEVFNFTLREEPPAVAKILEDAALSADNIDYFLFHQANQFILQHLRRKLRLPEEKVPMRVLETHGNQSSASVAACLADLLQNRDPDDTRVKLRLLCSGFGVGLSWANVIFSVDPAIVCSTFAFRASDEGNE